MTFFYIYKHRQTLPPLPSFSQAPLPLQRILARLQEPQNENSKHMMQSLTERGQLKKEPLKFDYE